MTTTQNTSPLYCGVDICKTRLDVSCNGQYRQYPYSKEGVKQLVKEFKSKDATLQLIYESTGRLSANLHAWIRDSKVAQSMLNPAQVRYFAKALTIDAKTDKLDAKVLEIFAQTMHPKPNLEKSNDILELQELYTHLDLLISNRTGHKIELSGELNPSVKESAERVVKYYSEEIDKIKERIKQLINAHKELKMRYDFFMDQAGIGERGATTLVILMPELGYLNRGQVASLAGVAPFNHESGAMRGKRTIRGGRKRVRSMMYLCVLSAIRQEGVLRDYYLNALERGKSKKPMLIGCIRKLLIHLNSKLKKKKLSAESVITKNAQD